MAKQTNIFSQLMTVVWYLIQGFLIALLLLVGGALVLDRLRTPIRYRLYNVQSGSMAPKIPLGSVVVVVPQADYRKDDIVTYRAEGKTLVTTTHRIVEVGGDKDLGLITYRTKGDANNAPDPEPVAKTRVIGRVIVHIPFLGYPIGLAQTQTGFIVLIIVPATLLVYSELSSLKHEVGNVIQNWQAKRQASNAALEEQVKAAPKPKKSLKKKSTASKKRTKKKT